MLISLFLLTDCNIAFSSAIRYGWITVRFKVGSLVRYFLLLMKAPGATWLLQSMVSIKDLQGDNLPHEKDQTGLPVADQENEGMIDGQRQR